MQPNIQPTSGDAAGGAFLLVIIFVGALIHLGLCYAIGKFAESKGRDFWLGFLLTFFTSPLIGVLVIAVLGDDVRVRR